MSRQSPCGVSSKLEPLIPGSWGYNQSKSDKLNPGVPQVRAGKSGRLILAMNSDGEQTSPGKTMTDAHQGSQLTSVCYIHPSPCQSHVIPNSGRQLRVRTKSARQTHPSRQRHVGAQQPQPPQPRFERRRRGAAGSALRPRAGGWRWGAGGAERGAERRRHGAIESNPPEGSGPWLCVGEMKFRQKVL